MKHMLAALLCLCLLAFCACGRAAPPEQTAATEPTAAATQLLTSSTTQAPTLPPVECPASYKAAPAAYKPVLDDLYTLKQWLWSGETDREINNWDQINAMPYAVDIMGAWNDAVDGYAIADINDDGTPELLLLTNYSEDPALRSLFTLSDGEPICLGFYGPRFWGDVAADGTVWHAGSDSADSGSRAIYSLAPHASELTFVVGHDYDYWPPEEQDMYYRIVNGERKEITEKEYRAIAKQYADAEKTPMKLKFIPIEQ